MEKEAEISEKDEGEESLMPSFRARYLNELGNLFPNQNTLPKACLGNLKLLANLRA